MAMEILPNLWLGNILDARNKEFMEKIDVVINCSKNIPFYSKKSLNIRIRVNDDLTELEITNLYKYLHNVTAVIHKHLRDNKIVLVHCYAGKQRSASIVCAYIMRYLNISYIEATDLMRSKRSVVFMPLPNFDSALKLYQENLNKMSKLNT